MGSERAGAAVKRPLFLFRIFYKADNGTQQKGGKSNVGNEKDVNFINGGIFNRI